MPNKYPRRGSIYQHSGAVFNKITNSGNFLPMRSDETSGFIQNNSTELFYNSNAQSSKSAMTKLQASYRIVLPNCSTKLPMRSDKDIKLYRIVLPNCPTKLPIHQILSPTQRGRLLELIIVSHLEDLFVFIP